MVQKNTSKLNTLGSACLQTEDFGSKSFHIMSNNYKYSKYGEQLGLENTCIQFREVSRLQRVCLERDRWVIRDITRDN